MKITLQVFEILIKKHINLDNTIIEIIIQYFIGHF